LPAAPGSLVCHEKERNRRTVRSPCDTLCTFIQCSARTENKNTKPVSAPENKPLVIYGTADVRFTQTSFVIRIQHFSTSPRKWVYRRVCVYVCVVLVCFFSTETKNYISVDHLLSSLSLSLSLSLCRRLHVAADIS